MRNILIIKGASLSGNIISSNLFALQGSVHFINFRGTVDHITDLQNETWYWDSLDSKVTEIIGVVVDNKIYTKRSNFQDLFVPVGTYENGAWWFDEREKDTDPPVDLDTRYAKNLSGNPFAKTLYINFKNSHVVSKRIVIIQSIKLVNNNATYSSNISVVTDNNYNKIFYSPIINNVDKIKRSVDVGIVNYPSIRFSIDNLNRTVNETDLDDSGSLTKNELSFFTGTPFQLIKLDGDSEEISLGEFIGTGFCEEHTIGRESVDFTFKSKREFQNNTVCQNAFTISDYTSIDNKYIGKPIPCAYGQIKRGIAVPINSAGYSSRNGGTVTFVVTDKNLTSAATVAECFDENDNSYPVITTPDGFTATFPAETNIDTITWRGIVGSANGLRIIREVFELQGGIPYIDTYWDKINWQENESELISLVGLSIQNTMGIIENIVEPISLSFEGFGFMEETPEGKYKWNKRRVDSSPVATIGYTDILSYNPPIIDAKNVKSKITVMYARNFVNEDKSLSIKRNDFESEVNLRYNNNKSQEVKTVLYHEIDAIAIGEQWVNEVSSADYTATIKIKDYSFDLYDVIILDIGRLTDRPSLDSVGTERYYFEVKEKEYDAIQNEFEYKLKLLVDRGKV